MKDVDVGDRQLSLSHYIVENFKFCEQLLPILVANFTVWLHFDANSHAVIYFVFFILKTDPLNLGYLNFTRFYKSQ